LAERPEALAARMGLGEPDFLARLDAVSDRLYAARAKRPQPRLDDKVLTSWNGLMIAALARAGLALQERRYVQAAAAAADFVFAHMRDTSGELVRSWRAGRQGPGAVLEDYAFFIDGLLGLRAADAATGWLKGGLAGPAALSQARALAERAEAFFGDGEGGYF